MTRQLYILDLGRLYVVVVEGAASDADARQVVKELRSAGLRGSIHVVSTTEMEERGWIRKERANLYADYGY